jgi:hypothetical protein
MDWRSTSARRPHRLLGAQVRRLEERAQGPLGRDGMLLDEVAVPDDQAAEVLGPGAVHRAVDQDMADLLRAQLLWRRREAEERIDHALT